MAYDAIAWSVSESQSGGDDYVFWLCGQSMLHMGLYFTAVLPLLVWALTGLGRESTTVGGLVQNCSISSSLAKEIP